MRVTRDYGSFDRYTNVPNEFDVTTHGQVFQATHEGDGSRLPLMYRSFISFSYGGKNIEDFDLIAVTDGDRMNKDGYSSFNDITSSYDNLDGQKYWNTHYTTNTISFKLVTDGMEQRQLDDFLYWFSAGVCRELILAEHPNRAQLARVASVPKLHLLPFEKTVQAKISEASYTTKTTLYKGEIELELIMDSPHWYSVVNLLGKLNEAKQKYDDIWHDPVTNEDVDIFLSQDALKIFYEDGIPIGSMISGSMLLGNGAYANAGGEEISKIWYPQDDVGEDWKDPNFDYENSSGARICDDTGAGTDASEPYLGIIAGAIIDASGNGIVELTHNEKGYFFYSGTAPAPTIIQFSINPNFTTGGYINVPYNSKTPSHYNTITIESREKQVLKFTTPNLFTSFNKAVDIFLSKGNKSAEDVRKSLRDNVRHPAVRSFATDEVNSYASNWSTVSSATLVSELREMFNVANGAMTDAVTFTFNSATGEAIGKFKYKEKASGEFKEVEEDVGDMLCSNYIIIRERNYPSSTGAIMPWEHGHEEYSHCIYHDLPVSLKNLSILYKNMYL